LSFSNHELLSLRILRQGRRKLLRPERSGSNGNIIDERKIKSLRSKLKAFSISSQIAFIQKTWSFTSGAWRNSFVTLAALTLQSFSRAKETRKSEIDAENINAKPLPRPHCYLPKESLIYL
jgi:hypothetical protein